jgi:hypothetical protein
MNFDLFAEPAAPTVEVPPPVQRDLVPCKYCVAWFMPLDYMPWRMDGYCSPEHGNKCGGSYTAGGT